MNNKSYNNKTNACQAYLMLGSNLGNRLNNLTSAEMFISKQIGNILISSDVYETESWGKLEQPLFLNKLLVVETLLNAETVLEVAMKIELDMGRKRSLSKTWEARSIDIDILYFDRQVVHTTNLIIPHPRLHLRNFVLYPLNDIAPQFLHPVLNKSSTELLNECKDVLKVRKHFHN